MNNRNFCRGSHKSLVTAFCGVKSIKQMLFLCFVHLIWKETKKYDKGMRKASPNGPALKEQIIIEKNTVKQLQVFKCDRQVHAQQLFYEEKAVYIGAAQYGKAV